MWAYRAPSVLWSSRCRQSGSPTVRTPALWSQELYHMTRARSHPTPPRTLGLATSTRLAAEVPTGCQRRVVSGGSTPTSIPSSALSVVLGSLTVVFGYILLRATHRYTDKPRLLPYDPQRCCSWDADGSLLPLPPPPRILSRFSC